MRLFRAFVAAALLAAVCFIGGTAIEQFENYQEFGMEYFTPFHLFNIVAITLVAVAILVLAISVAADRVRETASFFQDYVRAVLLGTIGIVAIGVAWYESEIMEEPISGFFPNVLQSHAYHWGDLAAVWAAGAFFVILALYYLFREDNEVAQSVRQTPPAPAEPATNEGSGPRPGFEIELRGENLVIRGDYPEADELEPILSLLRSLDHAPASYGIFPQPFGIAHGIPVDVISLHDLVDVLRKRREEEEDKPSGNGDTPSDKTPSEDVPQH